MATDERKDREHDKAKKDENLKDLSAKRPDAEKEEQVKGGFNRGTPALDAE
jgi:hypothetical protein